jgi:signal transduction histidine kinase
MNADDDQKKLKELEKQVRILKKKLERSEVDRHQLETTSEERERILKGVIRNFESSQSALEKRSRELETALSDLKALQVKLIESEKMSALGTLVAGIAHEINNPIGFISGNLNYAQEYAQDLLRLIQLYQQHYPDPATEIQQEIETIDLDFLKQDVESLFESMHLGADRISQIIQSLRTFSRLDEAVFKRVDLHQGIDSTIVILNNRLKSTSRNSKGIELIRDYGQIPLITCYPSQLNQVFINLLNNAIDALEEANQKRTPEESIANPNTIWIRTYLSTENQIVISIADNGLGIPDTIRPKIFDPFFTTKPIGQGTGLGLSVSYQIVTDLHGGKLSCYSTIGQRTEFIVTLPIQAKDCKI